MEKPHYCHIHFDDDNGWQWLNQGKELFPHDESEKPLTEEEIELFEDWLLNKFILQSKCPFCNFELKQTFIYAEKRDDKLFRDLNDQSVNPVFGAAQDPGDSRLWVCPSCYYWQWYCEYHTNLLAEYFYPDYWNRSFAVSQLAAFSGDLPEEFTAEMAQQLRRNPVLWHSMSPKNLEKIVRDIFRANFTDCEVLHVGSPGDGGMDVLMIDNDERRWMISVKRREKPEKGEPVSTIRDLIGAMVLEGGSIGVIASTADHFTTAAKRAVQKAATRGHLIHLLDRGRLNRLIGKMLPRIPWKDAIEDIHPEESSVILEGLGEQRFAHSLSEVLGLSSERS